MEGVSRFLSRKGRRAAGDSKRNANTTKVSCDESQPTTPRRNSRMFRRLSTFLASATEPHCSAPASSCDDEPKSCSDWTPQPPPAVPADLYKIFSAEDEKKQDKEEAQKV